ncbi:hemolysin family protein [Marinilactibacillus sp. XAAS-LB27]|uniref:HlyC/CorC family transporter n=1 Tax=Marinilactibacillus sp. XAAS-LB27 TaxID=3114538 RepID=UPI002E182A98|nr:hemolysin family protein [Marinilactibacillus sp. XAAS-LB27]
MDSGDLPSIMLLIVLIALSAFFSSSETAFTSANQIRLKNEAENGSKQAKRTLDLAKNFDAVLSTLLIGNNIVNIATSAIATLLFIGWFPTYGATIATVVTTIVVLIFGEITPKTIAKEKSETIAKFSAPIIIVLIKIFRPAIWFFEKWRLLLDKIFNFESQETISEEELLSMIDQAELGGSIEDHEHKLVRSALNFDDFEVSKILKPRVDVVGCDMNEKDSKIEELFSRHNFSRLIVYDDTIDHVVGVLHEKEFNRYLKVKVRTGREASIMTIVKEVIFVPPVMNLSKLLRMMQLKKTHMAIVTDEHGGTKGIATMEDVLEELVGEIWDESDTIEEEIIKLDNGASYIVNGNTKLEKLFDLFHLENTVEFISNTVSGFIIENLNRVPDENEKFTYKNMDIMVIEVKNRRVLEIQVDYAETKFEEES